MESMVSWRTNATKRILKFKFSSLFLFDHSSLFLSLLSLLYFISPCPLSTLSLLLFIPLWLLSTLSLLFTALSSLFSLSPSLYSSLSSLNTSFLLFTSLSSRYSFSPSLYFSVLALFLSFSYSLLLLFHSRRTEIFRKRIIMSGFQSNLKSERMSFEFVLNTSCSLCLTSDQHCTPSCYHDLNNTDARVRAPPPFQSKVRAGLF